MYEDMPFIFLRLGYRNMKAFMLRNCPHYNFLKIYLLTIWEA
nr:MAG TPA: hypothetical protein [Caudoviricetes sp.]